MNACSTYNAHIHTVVNRAIRYYIIMKFTFLIILPLLVVYCVHREAARKLCSCERKWNEFLFEADFSHRMRNATHKYTHHKGNIEIQYARNDREKNAQTPKWIAVKWRRQERHENISFFFVRIELLWFNRFDFVQFQMVLMVGIYLIFNVSIQTFRGRHSKTPRCPPAHGDLNTCTIGCSL